MGQPKTEIPKVAHLEVKDDTLRGLIGYQMKRAFNVVQGDLIRALKPFDLRMLTYTALVLIVDNPGLRLSHLAAAMDMERPNLVVIVDELEQRGLIARERIPSDRRAFALHASLQGQALYKRAVAAVAAHEARLFQALDPETRKTVIAALRTLQQAGDRILR